MMKVKDIQGELVNLTEVLIDSEEILRGETQTEVLTDDQARGAIKALRWAIQKTPKTVKKKEDKELPEYGIKNPIKKKNKGGYGEWAKQMVKGGKND